MHSTHVGGEFGLVLLVGLALFLVVVLYFLPTFVAGTRRHPNTVPIFILNLFLGLTGAGWVIALVWALTHIERPLGFDPRWVRRRHSGATAVLGALTMAALCVGVVGAGLVGVFSARSVHSHQFPVGPPALEARAAVPAEAKIDHLKQEITKLTPEMEKQRGVIVKETVEVQNLTKDVAERHARLTQDNETLAGMRQAIKDNKEYVTRDGVHIPRKLLDQQFASKFDEYKAVKQAASIREETLKRHQERLDAARRNLASLESKQKEMKAKVEILEDELANLRAAEARNEDVANDDKVANVNRLVDDIETGLAEQKKELELRKGDNSDRDIENTLKAKARSKDALQEWDESNRKK